MTSNDILNNAIKLIKTGEKAEAQKLLEPYLEANPQDVTAWLWKARTWPSLESRIRVLETCLMDNPDNQQIKPVLAALHTQRNRIE
jgi:hypothetical protein